MKSQVQTPSASPKAFTLLELLVVVAIIAVLAAIAVPVFSRIHVSSLKAKGLSNAKQLHTFFVGYCADHNGQLPLGGGLDGTRNALSWVNRLLPYAGLPELAETNLNDWWDRPPPHPAFKDPGIDLPGEKDRIKAATLDAIWGFAYNVQPLLPDNDLFLANWQEQPLEGVTLASISSPSRRILFGSGFDWHITGNGWKRAYHRYGKDQAIALFFDGHAKIVSSAEYDAAYNAP